MEDAKYCGRDWIPTGNWPQVRYNPAYNRTTPDNLAQVLRCGSSHPSLPLLYLPTSFTLSLSQLGIFQGHYKVWEWLEHIVFMSTSCMFSSHMPYNTLLLHIIRNRKNWITRTWHPLSDVDHLTRRETNFHGIAKWRKYLKTSWQFDFEGSTHDRFKGHLCEQLCQYPSNC